MRPTLKHDYAEVNGVRLHYVRAGEGRLIIFLHGFPEFWYAWKNQLEEFGRDHNAIALDMRGYNLSSKPAAVEAYQLKHIVEDIRAFAQKLGYERCVLVGHDWGGAAAWAFAIAHPEHLEELVIINAPHPGVFQRELMENPDQQNASQYMLMFRSPRAERILSASNYAALVDIVLTPGLKAGFFTAEDRAAYLQAWSQPGALTGGLNYYRAAGVGPPSSDRDSGTSSLLGTDYSDPEDLIVKAPTLVIWGEQDTALLTGNLEGLDEYVPDLTIRRIAEGTHWVIHEQPVLVNNYIRAFIT